MIVSLMTAELFEVRLLGRLRGVILTADGIAEAVAPWIVGRMPDATGTYTEGVLILIGMALVGATVVAALPQMSARA